MKKSFQIIPSLIADASKKELTITDICKEDSSQLPLYFSTCLLSRGHKKSGTFFSQKNHFTRQLSLMVCEKDVAGTWTGKSICHRTWATVSDLSNAVLGKTRCCSDTLHREKIFIISLAEYSTL